MTKQMTLTTMDLIEKKISETLKKVKDGLPHTASKDGVYDDTKPSWWTSGFWPGILWNLYDQTGKEEYKKTALSANKKIASYFREYQEQFDHDVGFQFLLTAVYHYEITGNEDSKRIGIEAANFLAGRFNPIGRFIKSWDRAAGWVIVDCLMNLSLLFWASRVTGDPRYKQIAILHADTFLKYGVREDGSTCHILSFDPETGEFIEALGGQGFSPDSSWSRGNAWAIYGYANMYRFTGDEKYLMASKKIAHQFLASLPEDFVPYWDHRASSIETEPRDSSAAAITASGLIELANQVPQNEKRIYLNAARKIVKSLSKHYSTWDQPEHQAVLIEGTGHRPKGNFVNASLIYGDYYFIEAISKLNGYNKYIF
ncbi:glycoside hydrolase family 88 protein [Fredinandcohnia sp. QZ13]|uniref:glycoside hydrolase family 88 protein n=1 Tax=Fredinandcohnia sp. QZ13 TaxID=3073144 RepID=UPI0028530F30|nr:glycoside hydrolase family 88 protein [Fredinandcohnia sp. QZ13]MDR4888112.1 glycoside hydrolase family 88 protein [Fredinandcohnia sp. QZ13]